jgi:hypothetical protein
MQTGRKIRKKQNITKLYSGSFDDKGILFISFSYNDFFPKIKLIKLKGS